MTDEVMSDMGFLSIIRNTDRIYNEDIIVRTLGVGASTARAGEIVATDGETAYLVDRAVTTDVNILGIILGPVLPADTYDIDDTLTDGIDVFILKLRGIHGAYQVAVFHEATAGVTALEEGMEIQVGAGAGKTRILTYADSTAATDMSTDAVGSSAETSTVSTTDDHIIVINWGR